MNDIYLKRRTSNRGCLVAIALLLCIVVALVWYVWKKMQPPDYTKLIDSELLIEDTIDESSAKQPYSPTAGTTKPSTTMPNRANTAEELFATQEVLGSGDLLKAREEAQYLLKNTSDPALIQDAYKMIAQANSSLLFSDQAMPEKIVYTVKRGDTLGGIANHFNTTIELIQKSNHLSSSLIRVGQRLLVFKGSFSVLIDKSDNDLFLYCDGAFFKHYKVGTGENNKTPVGQFKINDRISKPTWWKSDGEAIPYGDPDNELGTHWLSLNIKGYGLHGTWEPSSIGKQMSAGCIRLLNQEIEELYNILPLGTRVEIRD